MSRIQNILEKAERDGGVRRVRDLTRRRPARTLALGPPSRAAAGHHRLNTADRHRRRCAAAAPALDAVADRRRRASTRRLDRRARARRRRRRAVPRAADAESCTPITVSPVNVVLITSPGRGEGKSSRLRNLGADDGAGMAAAHLHRRRRPAPSADAPLFGMPDGPGAVPTCSPGDATLDEALVTLEDHQLTILPAGQLPAHPAELLGTTAMRRTLDTLRSQFDRVVIDAPAAAPLADVSILTPLVDRVLLVVRAGLTTKPAIHDAVAAIDGVEAARLRAERRPAA